MAYTPKRRQKTWLDYRNMIKYGLFLLLIFSMVVSIRTYLNFTNIEQAISDVQNQIIDTREEIAFQESFLIPYLASDHARMFAANENNKPLPGSYFIQFTRPEVVSIEKQETETLLIEQALTPQESWKIFFADMKKRNGR